MPKKRAADGRKSPAVRKVRINSPIVLSESEFWEPGNDEYQTGNTSQVLQITLPNLDDNRPYAWVKIHHLRVKGLLDSGSNRTLISHRLYQRLRGVNLRASHEQIVLRSANGGLLKITGEVYIPFTFDGRTKIVPTLVVDGLVVDCLLGMTFWSLFNIYPKIDECGLTLEEDTNDLSQTVLSPQEIKRLEEVKASFVVAIPNQVSTTHLTTHKIEIQDDWKTCPPIRQYPYTMSPKIREKVSEELDRMLGAGIIERCHSDWSQNVVPVIKPSGKVRLCLDARKINERTIKDAYPLHHPGRILGQLPKAKYLSTLDLSEAFLQIPLDQESRRYTAFSILGKGMFQFTRLPFGLVNSPATLARLMDQVLGHGELEPFVFVYLDDIVLVSETFDDHLRLLKEVARRLREANLAINLGKSRFGVSELPFLGYLLSTEGLRPNPEKVRAIIDYERPNTLTKLRRFLGMANYYRRFINDFSGISSPLTDLLKSKSKVLPWHEKAEDAFCAIKEKLISAPILVSPNFSLPFSIQTDASDVAVAGVLTQVQDDHERVIAYFSHKLTTPERNYHACEKETLAALMSIEAFRGYIEGSHFTLITDSSALTHILRTKWKTSSRCSRWSLTLQQYNMTIVHRKGKDHVVPDALSRCIAVVTTQPTSPWYKDLKDKVERNPDDYVDFKVDEGILYKFVSTPKDPYDHRFEWKKVIAPEDRLSIFLECHDNAMHQGFERTLSRAKLRYYWPRMAKDIKEYVQNCTLCKQTKAACVPVVPPLGEQRVTTHPWQIIATDYIGPLPRSKKGNQHILVTLDLFSKWVMLSPVRKIDSGSLCRILKEHWFARYSTPEIIISDNASVFLSREFKSLLERFHIKHWLNTKYHSQANPVERVNRTINAAIRTYVRQDQRDWDTRLSEIETILNTSKHSSTALTPFFIVHGHEAFLRGTDHKWFGSENEPSSEEQEENRENLFTRIYDLVKTNLQKAHESGEARYNLRHRKYSKAFQVGQLVYYRNMKQSNAAEAYCAKYGPLYLPAKVKACVGSSSYEIEDLDGKNLGLWSAAHLKPG